MPADKKNPFIREAITWRTTGDKTVVLNLETSEYYSTNEAGTFVWELFAAGRKKDKIAAALAEEYAIPPAQAEKDTSDFLKELARLKIIAPEAAK